MPRHELVEQVDDPLSSVDLHRMDAVGVSD
jgi:hypothetical protein